MRQDGVSVFPRVARSQSKKQCAALLALASCEALWPAWRLVSQILPLGPAQRFEASERRVVVFQTEQRLERRPAKRMGQHLGGMLHDEPRVVTQGHGHMPQFHPAVGFPTHVLGLVRRYMR